MNRRITALFCLGCAALLAAAPVRADEPNKPLPPEQVYRWGVHYLDSILGPVTGNATVDWKKGRAVVVLDDPVTGKKVTLKSKSVQAPGQGGGIATIVLEGYSPDSPVAAPPLDGMRNLGAAAGTKTKIRDEAAQIKARVQSPRYADDATVTIELAADSNGMLQGRWSYIADPRTERDRNGRGRAGTFEVLPDADAFLGRESGVEVWEPLTPEIHYVQVVENQLETFQLHNGELANSYPYHGDNSTPSHRVQPGMRTLLVLGRNLPVFPDAYPDLAGRALVEPTGGWDSPSSTWIGYHAGIPVNSFEIEDAAEARALDLIKQGWKRLAQRIEPQSLADIRGQDLETALVKVGLPVGAQSVIPKVEHMEWAGAHAPWLLQFGDNSAQLDFVRPLRVGLDTRWEPAPLIFSPEKIALELRTRLPLPLASIPIRLSLGGRETSVPAARVDVSPQGAVYRTALLTLTPAAAGAAGGALEVHPGDLLQAMADTQAVIFNEGALADATVSLAGTEKTEWQVELHKAAEADGLPVAGVDDGTLAVQEAAAFHNLSVRDLVGSQGDAWVKTSFQVGDHAALLLLRDQFVRTLRSQINGLKAFLRPGDPAGDEQIRGWANTANAHIQRDPASLWGKLAAGEMPGRGAVTLAQALDRPAVEAACGGDLEAADKWQLGAARIALGDYIQQLEKSQAKAEAVKDNDFAALAALATRGFEAFNERLQSKLMRFDPASGLWVPDTVARAFVQHVAGKYDAVLARDKLSSEQWAFAVNLVTAVAPVAGSYSVLTRVLVAAGNGLIWEINSAAEIYQTYEAKQEVRFAFGAQGVLGDARLEKALLDDRSWWATAASITGQGLFVVFDGFQALKEFDVGMRQVRGRLVFKEASKDLSAIRQMPTGRRTDLLAFLELAHGLQQEGRQLDELQQTALAQWERLSKNLTDLKRIDEARIKVTVAEQQLNTRISSLEKEAAAGSKEAGANLENLKTRQSLCGEVRAALGRESEGIILTDAEALAAAADQARVAPPRVKLSQTDIDWLSGRTLQPNVERVMAVLSENKNQWKAIKSGYKQGAVSIADMHQFVTFREQKMTKLLNEAKRQVTEELINETQAALGGTRIAPDIRFKALGSKNLTSDLDFSVVGEGAERVVIRFNKLFREDASLGFSGLESGYVFDTNAYTDPIYRIFRNSTVTGRTFNLANTDLDSLRQIVYQTMATVKYSGGARSLAAEKELILGALEGDVQKLFALAFEEAEAAEEAGLREIAHQAGTSTDALHGLEGTNQLLRVQNLSYEKTLDNISQWRREYSRLDELLTTGQNSFPKNAAFFDNYPAWNHDLKHLEELFKKEGKTLARIKADTALAKELGEAWRERIIFQLRKKQGEALYFASEAYQTEATIFHVVDDIQEARKNTLDIEKLLGGPLPSKVSPAGSLTSLMENRANLIKEIGHVVNPATGLPDKPADAVAGCVKYFIRMVDAAHQSGADLHTLLDEKFLRATVMLNNRRGNLEDVKSILGVFGEVYRNEDPLAYFQAMREASDKLARYTVQQPHFSNLAKRITPLLDDVVLAKTAAKRSVDGFEKIP